ncbi:MAG: 30S ribosomal protein S7 [Chloroflexi bacterium]|nr:30S ribosomal protein S7 [Chloroflexota bacterium]MCY3581077.1 30S ribosomal protein S7 [Chloroflexota bacterium]MCY3715266.1 30S ribosomal protein S7 [Chloroflexota bacterium]MDE2650037.1 30S ribosomal protein S7 [Chloroflexota bacterium]MXX50174.1 30S ribosomal protein S7 [Chloroflexota bacterium]
MPRRNRPPKRIPPPDAKYGNLHVAMFINRMMRGGKKSLATRIMYDAFNRMEERAKKDPVEVFEIAIRNVAPAVEVKPKRVGGSTYQVPIDVSHERGITLAMRWLIMFARARSGRSMAEKLTNELLDAYNGQGNAVRRKDETHRMAEANRAFAHFR